MDEDLEAYFEAHRECYDRFTFDEVFRHLLSLDYSHEDALFMILMHCSLSALVVQERMDNGFYRTMSAEENISSDLTALRNEIWKQRFLNPN